MEASLSQLITSAVPRAQSTVVELSGAADCDALLVLQLALLLHASELMCLFLNVYAQSRLSRANLQSTRLVLVKSSDVRTTGSRFSVCVASLLSPSLLQMLAPLWRLSS